MEYTIRKLADLSGVSTRTLRYYDEIGLLKPARISSGGYRIYGEKEVDRLQQILFYRELGVKLEEIGHALRSGEGERLGMLREHLTALQKKKEELDRLIDTVRKSIEAARGERSMSDHEKFEGFKREIIEENEKKYGDEIRGKYGAEAVEESNRRVMSMSEEDLRRTKELEAEIAGTLKEAAAQGDPESESARKLCELHRQWLTSYWPEGNYTKEAHLGLGEMYAADERFKKYYDAMAEGGAEFLRDALRAYCRE